MISYTTLIISVYLFFSIALEIKCLKLQECAGGISEIKQLLFLRE